MHQCLDGRGGEVSARARAASLGRIYLELNPEGRERFLRILAVDFAVDETKVDAAIAEVGKAQGRASRRRAEAALKYALEAPRLKLLTQFNGLPEGVKFLVDMRAELLRLVGEDPALIGLEEDLRGLLTSWFDVGFLELRRITWGSPAALLEKIVAYEAVHEITNWDDLKSRLDSDRRLYAYFHPRMPEEPLIFVEVALMAGIADNVQTLLDPKVARSDPRKADAAIFYSISNAQEGLAGISFGDFLIKRVVDSLANEFKGLKTFATLSPIPGFRRWLDSQLMQARDSGSRDDAPGRLTAAECRELAGLASGGTAGLSKVLSTPNWYAQRDLAEALRTPLMRLCARYLLTAKRSAGGALDPVAHFHLSNGARLERINWLADTSPKGLTQSAGLMVNYLYKLDKIDDNHEAYTGKGTISAAASVRSLAKA
ncbi:MAG: malonyl-CoA decarboxylase [Alphaproteobacteria bacterium]|nr:malonyl-CoA decarboxylase [Alphaproteobacteria bacterium]